MEETIKKYEAPKLFTSLYQLMMKLPFLQNIRINFYLFDSMCLFFLKKPHKKKDIRKQVLVVFPFALGDCVMFSGVTRYLRDRYPKEKYELTITCQKSCAVIFEKDFDYIVSCEYTKSSINIKTRIENYKILRQNYYDIILDPISNADCTPNIFVTNATVGGKKIGVLEKSNRKLQCPDWIRRKIYTQIYKIESPNLHRIQFYAEFLKKNGCLTCVASPTVFPSVDLKLKLPEHFFVIFPSASLAVKKWPAERFAELANRIYEQTGMVMLLCGTEHDKVDIDHMCQNCPMVPVADFIGKTNPLEFAEIIRRADFVVTNDTSTYHFAIAQKTLVFLICGGYVFDTFANYCYEDEGYPSPVLIYRKRECFNCNNYCKYKFTSIYPCVDEITVDEVWSAVEQKLSNKK